MAGLLPTPRGAPNLLLGLMFVLQVVPSLGSAGIFTNPLQMRKALIREAGIVERLKKVEETLSKTEVNTRNRIDG